MLPADRSLQRETEAAKRLIENMPRDDEQLIADSIEGETNLREAIEVALSEIDECEILIVGLEEKLKAFDARKKLINDRAERIRALIERALLETDQHSIKLPAATISLRTVPPALVVTSEADIPARFWIPRDRPAPKLDKKALAAAIKTDPTIPGATLDNGTVCLSVRRR